jgi:hypothetical protein
VAHRRHKREANARSITALTGSRAVQLAAGAAVLATLPAVALGVLAADPAAPATFTAHGAQPLDLDAARSGAPVSRSFDRAAQRTFQHGVDVQEATARAVLQAHVHEWTTTDLNLWSSASGAARQIGVLTAGRHVLVTGRTQDGRIELVVDGASTWVTQGYLAHTKAPGGITAASGLSMAPCPDSSVEYRLTPGAIYVYRSVCHAFPQITSYGGWAPRGEHADGKAIDIMTTDLALGNAIAAFLQQHAAELNLYDVIWQQHIWTPVRASEGWRYMPDRGSPTANHMNHVHVSVN